MKKVVTTNANRSTFYCLHSPKVNLKPNRFLLGPVNTDVQGVLARDTEGNKRHSCLLHWCGHVKSHDIEL